MKISRNFFKAMVGQTPWSARVSLDPASARAVNLDPTQRAGRGAGCRPGGPPHILLLLIYAAAVFGQSPRAIAISTGPRELVQFERDIERVAISEPKIADAIVVSPREIMINGKSAGKASLIVWDGGSAPTRFNINVNNDNSEHDISRKEL